MLHCFHPPAGDFQRVRRPDDFEGVLQGWVVPFRQRVGSVVRMAFAPGEGNEPATLFGGLTNRGWGGLPPADGIARIRWTGETPFEIQDVELVATEGQPGGTFRIELTRETVKALSGERWRRAVHARR